MVATDPATRLRNKVQLNNLRKQLRDEQQTKVDTLEARAERFTRLIRDGVADEIKGGIVEVHREIAQHRKMKRLSPQSAELAAEFHELGNQFLADKLALEKHEETIESVRAEKINGELPPHLQRIVDESTSRAKLHRDRCIESADRLITIHNRLDAQVARDRALEDSLRDAFTRCVKHLAASERGRVTSATQTQLMKLNIDGRIKWLRSVIQKLAETIPAVRAEEIGRLVDEAAQAFRSRKNREALSVLDQVFKFDKKHLEAHRLRASVYQAIGNKIAYNCELRMITEINDAEASDFYAFAKAMEAAGQDEEAFGAYQTASEKEPSPTYLEAWGDACGRKQRWYLAVPAYRSIVKQQPRNASALHKYGIALFENNQEDEAFDALRTAIRTHDHDPRSRICLGRIYRNRRMDEESVKSFQRSIELDQSNPEAYYWLATLLLDRGDFDQALKQARIAFDMDSERVRNRLLLARCLDASGDSSEAIAVLDHCFESNANPSLDVLLTYAQLCRNAGQVDQALERIDPVIKKFPRQPQLRAEYGLLLLYAKRIEDATSYLNPTISFSLS